MRSTQVAPILNLCAYLLLYFCCLNLRPASNVMLLKHWFQERGNEHYGTEMEM